MAVVLREKKLWKFVSTIVVVTLVDPIPLYLNEVKEERTHRILLDGVKNHLIPHLDKM